MTRCVVNVAAHDQYWKYQFRLKGSLDVYAPGTDRIFWKGEYPPGSPHHSEPTKEHPTPIPYGFKLYAIAEARRRGYEQILWLDSGVHLVRPLEPVWEYIEREGYFLVESEQILEYWCKEDVMQAYGATKEERETLRIISGATIGLDFTKAVAHDFFGGLWQAMEKGHYRGAVSNHSKLQDHRGDEAVGVILASRLGMKRTKVGYFHMADQKPISETGIFCSGYDKYGGMNA